MTHLTPAEVVALRDGEGSTVGPERTAHREGCSRCGEAVEEARFRARRIEGALPPGPDLSPARLEAARRAVRARLAAHDAGDARGGSLPVSTPSFGRRSTASLSRAAGLLLVLAGGAAALPGSPVRDWLGSLGEPAVETTEATDTVPAAASGTPAGETGIRLRVEGGPVEVVVRGLAAGARVEVTREEGPELSVFAPDGSRFASAGSRVTVDAETGPVRVRLPRGAAPATLRVNDREYLRWTASGPQVQGPGALDEQGRIVFEVGG